MRRPEEMWALRGPDGIDDVLAKLKRGPLAIDTETTGVDWHVDRVGSINLAAGRTAVFAYKGALAPVVRWLSREIKQGREFVFHHAKFDMHMLRSTFGLHFPYPVHDTQLQSYLLDQRGVGSSHNPNHHLKDLAKVFVDPDAKDADDELMKAIKERGGKTKGDWLLAPWRTYAKYSALDPWYTLQLHEQFIARIHHWAQPPGYPSLRSLYENEQWLTLALRDMEERGITVDRKFLVQWRDELRIQLDQNLARLAALLPSDRPMNWNSHPQVRKLLFGDPSEGGLGLTTARLTKKNKHRPHVLQQASTDKNALIELNHPIGAELLEYRKLSKQYGTFASGLLNAMWEEDHTIHTSFNQNVETGRMSAREPNLQQEDKKSGVRGAFIPRKGFVFRFADYSQGELRVAAILANEPALVRGFNEDPHFDAHTGTAAQMFGMAQPTSEYRDYGKTMNFAMLFGAGEDNVTAGLISRMSVKQAHRACRKMGHRVPLAMSPHRKLAQLLRARYREMMPAMGQTARERSTIAEQRGFTINLYGYHRYLDANECYKAFNTEIQGSLAHCGKAGLVRVYRELQLGTGELALLLQVHDELIYESEGDPRTDRRVLELLKDEQFSVPIIADMKGSSVSWQAKETVKL